MNGWKRLFLVLSVVSLLPGIALWIVAKPSAVDSHFVPECSDAGKTLIGKRDAARLLSEFDGKVMSSSIREDAPWLNDPVVNFPAEPQKIMWSDCAEQLRRITTGEIEKERFDKWIRALGFGAIFYAVFLGLIYASGWAVGWVWRGFVPRSKANS